MIFHLFKALGQLSDRRTRHVLWKSAAVTAILAAGLIAAAGIALDKLAPFEIGLVNGLVTILGGLAVLVIAMVLFPGAVIVVVGLFADEVADACEARHYPHLPPRRRRGIGEVALGPILFAAGAIALNLVCVPLYILLLPVPPLGIVLFYGVNGYLLGREYFELVASRRLTPSQATALRRAHAVRLYLYGAGIAFLLTVPVVNLVVPVLATAFMVHVVEAGRRKSGEPWTVTAE